MRKAKECLAFDLYSALKVADAQTSPGRIVLAPSAVHEDTFLLSFPKIQNQRGTALTIYAGISYALYLRDPSRVAFAAKDI